MPKGRFNFKWKLVENYGAAAFALVFLWFFFDAFVNKSAGSAVVVVIMAAVGPFLITFLDRKSSE